MRLDDAEPDIGGSDGNFEGRTEYGCDGGRSPLGAPGGAAADGRRMLTGGSDGGTLARFCDEPGMDGGGMLEPTGGSSEKPAPSVSASTLRTSAAISTGRTKRPLPSCAIASSGVATAPPGRARKSTSMASASGSSRMRDTTSSAPSLSASTRMTLGRCTATRATSIDSGTSTTV